jgi:hypothetical protein
MGIAGKVAYISKVSRESKKFETGLICTFKTS